MTCYWYLVYWSFTEGRGWNYGAMSLETPQGYFNIQHVQGSLLNELKASRIVLVNWQMIPKAQYDLLHTDPMGHQPAQAPSPQPPTGGNDGSSGLN